MTYTLTRTQVLPGPPRELFDFFADAANLEAITPPWLRFRIVTPQPIRLTPGALIEYRLSLHRIPIRWLTRIEVWEPGHRSGDSHTRPSCAAPSSASSTFAARPSARPGS